MKIKKFFVFFLLAFVALALVACTGKEDVDKKINEFLDQVAITYAAGDSASSVTKDVTLGKLDVAGVTVEWASNNAAITKEGKVTRGDADVNVKLTATLTYKEKTGSKDFNLTVKAKEVEIVAPLSVEISGNKELAIGAEYTFTAVVKPDDATEKGVTWAIDNTAVATIDASGKVKALSAGEATITATAKGDESVKGTFKITVAEPAAETIAKTIAKETGAEGWVKGTVVGVYAQGYMLYDGTGYILVYLGKDAEFTQTMGSYVEVKGVLGEYKGAKQFTKDATITDLEEGEDYKLNATNADNAAVLELMENVEYGKKIKVRVTITSASASFVNATVKDGGAGIALAYVQNYEEYEVGADYDVTGLVMYASEYNNVKSLYLMAEKAVKVDYGFEVTITYVDGESKEEIKINSLQFPVDELKVPAAKEGYVFLGWYKGSEDAPVKVYEIIAPEDITLTARWVLEADAPLIVNPDAEEGSGQYRTIADAIAAAQPGQTIELLPGEYAEERVTGQDDDGNDVTAQEILVNKKVTIIGPNVNVHGYSDDRNEGAQILSKVIVTANGVKFNGVDFLEGGIFEIKGAKHTLIDNCYFETSVFGNTGVNNRKASIYNNGAIEDVIIRNTCIIFPGSSYVNEAIQFDNDGITDFTLENCHLESTYNDRQVYECIMTYNIKGVFNFINNDFVFGSDGYVIRLGFNNTSCKTINIVGNKFLPLGDLANVTIGFASLDGRKGMDINIIGNDFINFAPSTFTFAGANSAGTTVTYMYNYFDGQQEFKIGGIADCTFIHDYNCTLGEYSSTNVIDIKAEDHPFADEAAVHAGFEAYKATLKKVTFDMDGGYEIYPIYFDNAEKVKLPDNADKDDFEFLGWYNASDIKVEFISALEDITLKAKWGKVYTVSFDVDGGVELAPLKFTAIKGLVLPVAEKEGFLLEGWYEGETKVEAITELRDYTLKAKWGVPNTITFDVDGGEELAALKFLDYAKVVLPTPVKEGYYFLGWYDGETKVEALTANADITLKASWRALATLEVDPADGSKYATIAAALEAANDGDTILVVKGDFQEDLVVAKNDITIKGAGDYAELTHKSEYVPAAENDTIIKSLSAKDIKGLKLEGIAFAGQVKLENVAGFEAKNIFDTCATDGAFFASGTNSDLVFADIYYSGTAPRVIYVTAGTTTNVTVDHLVVMDSATVEFDANGKYTGGVCDAIRFGQATAAKVMAGEVVVKNCYFRGGQSGVMDRFPDADKYVLEGNYFYKIPAAVYFRSAAVTNDIEYVIQFNTFVECGNSINDWDVIAVTTGDDTDAKVNYNAFIDSFPFKGTNTDYVIKIRSAKGVIDCSNNYFKVEAELEQNLNANGVSQLVINVEEQILADKEYDLYTIKKVNGKIVIMGLNYIFETAAVSLDGEEAVPVTMATYELPTPEKAGYEFVGWYETVEEQEILVTKITEARTYTLVSHWKKYSEFKNVPEGASFAINRETFFAEWLADFNTCMGTNYRMDNLPTGAWTLIGLETFFLTEPYRTKYLPMLEYIVAHTNQESQNKGQPDKLLAGIQGGATTVDELIASYGWDTSNSPYALQYETIGLVLGIKHTANANFNSSDYSQDELKYGIIDVYAPKKEGYVFQGWYKDAGLTEPVEGQLETYEQVYYAKWYHEPQTLIVDANDPTKYATIAAALEAAYPTDIICLVPGTYTEDVLINKGVVLTSALTSDPKEAEADYKDATKAAIIKGKIYVTGSGVTISHLTFTDTGRVGFYSVAYESLVNFKFEQNYVYDTAADAKAWQQTAYGVGAKNADTLWSTYVGVVNLAGYYAWVENAQILGNVFKNVAGTAVYDCVPHSIVVKGNTFDTIGVDAVRLDYSSTYGKLVFEENEFKDVKACGIYLRSYAASSGDTTILVKKNTFKNCGSADFDATRTAMGAFGTAAHQEATNATFTFELNVFDSCYNNISIRGNVSNSTTWAEKNITFRAIVEFNAFITNSTTKIYRNLFGSDTAATNWAVGEFNHNFYGTDLTTKLAVTAEQYENYVSLDTVVYDSYEAMLAAYTGVKVAAVAEAYVADFNTKNGTTLTADKLDTAETESSYMVAMLTDEELMAKWSKLYAALAEVAGEESMKPANVTAENANDVKGLFLANLCGFFTQTKHTDTYLAKESADFTVAANVDAVLALLG